MSSQKAIDLSTSDRVPLKTWIGLFGTILGAFMAVLDIQITNASLKEIQASLGATLEEGSWISTAYLVAEIIVIPLTGWLSQVFSIRRYILINTALFTIFSMSCAWAWNLPSMIVFRGLQGFTGGSLIPMTFTFLLTNLPPKKQPIGMALFAITATFAPSIGPSLGGWLTDNYGWQYIFYINLVPGLLLLSAVWYAVEPQPLKLHLLKEGDWGGIIAMALGLGSLQVVLEEGSRKDWFNSDVIVQLTIIASIFLTLFIIIELTRKHPFINLRLLKKRNFGLCAIINISMGIGLYGSIYILPLYLAQIQNYNAMQIGQVLMWVGFPQLLIIPFVPKLMQKIDMRLIIAVGVSLFATSCFMNAGMSHDTGLDQLRLSQLVRAMGQPLIMVPLSTIATAGMAKQDAGSASGLFNMMRNLGGSLGIAILATLVTQREQFHSNRLGEFVSSYNSLTQERLDTLTQVFISKGIDIVTAQNQAIATLDKIVRREAYVMAFNDCFYFIGMALLLSGLAIIFLKKVKPGAGGSAH
ncbi:MAG: DHA2 family efflux MFS transporter permease subunit [Microcoleaceae cyanobacterium]